MKLPVDLDYKIIRGYSSTPTLDIVVFSKKKFEETGSEYEAEVFRVTVTNKEGSTEIEVIEESTTKVEMF